VDFELGCFFCLGLTRTGGKLGFGRLSEKAGTTRARGARSLGSIGLPVARREARGLGARSIAAADKHESEGRGERTRGRERVGKGEGRIEGEPNEHQ
jgi:hypothetical protein